MLRLQDDNQRAIIGNRIQEILDHNKKAKRNPTSIRDLATMLGHHSNNRVFNIIQGRYLRNLTEKEYELIAKALDMELNQLLEVDWSNKREEISRILHGGSDPEIALGIVNELISKARGATETFTWLYEKGNIYMTMYKFHEAKIVFEEAWQISKQIKLNQEEAIMRTMVLLSFAYYRLGENDNFLRTLAEALKETKSIRIRARAFYQRGLYAAAIEKDEELTLMWYKQALELFKQEGDTESISRIYHNLAEFYFKVKRDYEKSLDYHVMARTIYRPEKYDFWLKSDKDFARVLFCTGNMVEARELILSRLNDKALEYYPEDHAKLLLLLYKITYDPEHLRTILKLPLEDNNRWRIYASDMYQEYLTNNSEDVFAKMSYSVLRASSPIVHQKEFYEEDLF